jgi:hypothetical protein
MYKTSKSPRKVMLAALAVAQDALPLYSSRFSPRKFTLHQLFACLALKEFQRCDYRKICELLRDSESLREAIGLRDVPHFTTLQKRAVWMMERRRTRRLIASSLRLAKKRSC